MNQELEFIAWRIQSLENEGRKNIILSDDFNHLQDFSLRRAISFVVIDNMLWIKDLNTTYAPVEEVKRIAEALLYAVERFDEQKSIAEEISFLKQEMADAILREKTERKKKKKNIDHGYVYLLKGENGRYKIGKTKNPQSRLQQLSSSSCEKHELIHTIKTDRKTVLESKLHKRFSSKNTHSEWFELTDIDVDEICAMQDEV